MREVVYISDLLPHRFASFYEDLSKALRTAGIGCRFLPGTKDVWVRDFMPLQTAPDRFVRFTYNPDYLRKYAKWRRTISETSSICEAIGIKTQETNLLLDGGNLERFERKAILTDKVLAENPGYSEDLVRKELLRILGLEQLIFVPQEPGDILGHVDATARFLDADTVLVNDFLSQSQQRFCDGLQNLLHRAGLRTIPIPCAARDDQAPLNAYGLYMNFLRVGDCIFLPVFDDKTDQLALEAFGQLFHGYRIFPVRSNVIAAEGGALNCVTWNILV